MYLFEIFSIEPLEPCKDMKYKSLAGDGTSFLFLEQAGNRVIRHCPQLHPLEEYRTARPYTGICHDPVERCYWACSSRNSDWVYKLSETLGETDRFQLRGYDAGFGVVKSISYDRQDDCLVLTFHSRVMAVDKHAFCERAAGHCLCAQAYQACIRSCQFHYYISWQCGMEILNIARDGRLLIHSCLPVGHHILGMVETCGSDGPVVNFLSVKHGSYYYLLRGMLVNRQPPSAGPCQCPGTGTAVPPPCGGYPACPPVTDAGENTCHCHDHSGNHGGGHCSQDCCGGCDGSASIIESIALEQTALSHILNAEGEKIQKVVAVSDRPADFLHVNQSVLEMITKITHLEQVLYSKMELACGVLRGRGEDG